MPNDSQWLEALPRDRDSRPGLPGARAAKSSLIEDLEHLRELVLERLSAIERLAREHVPALAPGRELSALEQSLQKRTADLEEAQRQHRARAEREQQDWAAAMSQLDEDRRLLAEAWERIEKERTDDSNSSSESAAQRSSRLSPHVAVSGVLPGVGAEIPLRSGGGDSDAFNPVAQAILQQFQTLCGDVRKNARRSSR